MDLHPLILWFFMGILYFSMCYLAFRLNKALGVMQSLFGSAAVKVSMGFLCVHFIISIVMLTLRFMDLTDSSAATFIIANGIFSTTIELSQLTLGVAVLCILLKLVTVNKLSN